jgi:hypothetical protein
VVAVWSSWVSLVPQPMSSMKTGVVLDVCDSSRESESDASTVIDADVIFARSSGAPCPRTAIIVSCTGFYKEVR